MRGLRWPAPSSAGVLAAALVVLALSACAGGGSHPASSLPPTGDPAAVRDEAAAWWPSSPPANRWEPVAVLSLPGGKVAVAEAGQNRVFLLDPSGTVERLPAPSRRVVEWTALALGPGLFFYALDGPGRAVHQYDFEGNYLGMAHDLARTARDQGLGDVEPAGLAVDRAGQAVVTDRLGDRLLVFGPGWDFVGVWGQSGAETGSWRRPEQVAVGAQPPYLVADLGNRRLVLMGRFGEALGSRGLSDPPRGVAVLDGNRYAVSWGDRVEVLDADLVTRRIFRLPAGEGCADGPYVTSALAGHEGVVLAGEGCSGRVVGFRLRRD